MYNLHKIKCTILSVEPDKSFVVGLNHDQKHNMKHFHHLESCLMSLPGLPPLPRDNLFLTAITIGYISLVLRFA